MYFNRRCKITYICHGATIYSEEARLSEAQNYPPLSELGIEEMGNIINFLKSRGVKNDAIYTSPSVRTVQSAFMIAKFFKQDYEVVDDLTSRKIGSWNGLTHSQIMEKYPSSLSDMFNKPDEVPITGGESSVEFIARTKAVIDKIIDKNLGGRIIIVTYPEVIEAAICAALEISASALPKIYIRTGSATQISYFDKWASLMYCGNVPL